MASFQKIAIFGAGGTIGSYITSALVAAKFTVTIITRTNSETTFPENITVVRTEYTVPALTAALQNQDAVVSAVGVAGISSQKEMMDAAVAAGVKRFILSDFGYGPAHKSLPEFEPVGRPRRAMVEYAREKAAEKAEGFTWTAVAIGNPIDWALKKFTTLGFDISNRKAIIYDSGTERFTGTTMAGIASAVAGVLKHPEATANKHLIVRSVETCQNELLAAFEEATGEKWEVSHGTTKEVIARGREKKANGDGGWVLDLVVGQLLEEGAQRSILATKEEAANSLLEMPEENVLDMVKSIVS